MKSVYPNDILYELQKLVADMSRIDRSHFQPGEDRRENDIEHSFAVAMLCWYVIDSQKLNLDKAKVLQYALCHDFVERYAGDVNAYATEQERVAKIKNERRALEILSREFASFPTMAEAMKAYENKSDEEALFVWTIDKLQALVMDELSNWRAHEIIGVTYEEFQAKLQSQLAAGSPMAQGIYEAAINYSYTTFYDQPK